MHTQPQWGQASGETLGIKVGGIMKFGPFARGASSAIALFASLTFSGWASAGELGEINFNDANAYEGQSALGEITPISHLDVSPRINVRDDLTSGVFPYPQINSAPIFDANNVFNGTVLVEMYIPSLGGSGFCTGTVINQRTVLIAAHCVQNLADDAGVADGDLVPYIYTAPNALPDYFAFNAIEGTSHLVHSAYDRNAFYLGNDIALVSLAEPVSRSTRVGVHNGIPFVQLATSDPALFQTVTLVGYGQAGIGSDPGVSFNIRRRVATNQVDYVGASDDVLGGGGTGQLIFTDFADPTDIAGTDYFCFFYWGPPSCTVTPTEGSTDNGDSGGPLFVSNGSGGYIQVGVTSGGANACGGPQGGYCDIAFWTSVAAYNSWIQANSPLRNVTSLAGNANWTTGAHWSEGVMPDNFDTPTASITDFTNVAKYYNVTLSAAGTTTLSDAREVDLLTIAGANAQLNVTNTGSLFVWGDAIMSAGTLRVDGSMNVAQMMLLGGRLQGTGSIATPAGQVINAAGTIAPGNSIGTLTFANGFTQGAGGLLEIELTNGNSDRLAVTGNASLNGAVEFLVFGPSPLLGQSYNFLTTTGTVTGHFSTVIDMLPGALYPIVTYGSNFARVTVADFCSFASGPVQTPVCGALNNPAVQGDPDMAAALGGLQGLDSASIGPALEALNPTRAHAQTMVGLMSGDLLRNQFTRRGNDLLGGGEGGSNTAMLFDISSTQLASVDPTADMLASAAAAALADGENGGSSYDLPNGYGLYFAGDVAVAKTDQAGAIGKDDADIAAVTAGIDRNEGTGIIYGAALSFLQSTVSQNYGFGGETSSDGAALSVYGDMRRGRFYANAFLSAGFHSFDTERRLLVAPNKFATATGSTDASQFQLAAHGGFNVSSHKYTSFDLVGGVGYISVDIDGYSETGAGALSAVLAGRTVDSLITQVGGELTLHPDTDDGQLLPVLRVVWNHEFMDDPYVISTGFAGAPATTFTTPGPDLGSDWATVGLGIKGRVSESTSFVFRYELDVGRDGQDRQEVSAAARIAF